jgi:hypothetical protein
MRLFREGQHANQKRLRVTVSQSQRLRTVLSLAQGRLRSLIGEVWLHPRLGALYPEFLFATYGVTVASAPAMREAARLCAEGEGADSLKLWLKDYYLAHAAEEEDHAEWLLQDLKSLGIQREIALGRLPYPSVAALVGSQYYWMKHVHPVAYLGFIAVLEAPTEIGFLREVSERAGIAWGSMSCHARHAELDEGHVAEFDAMLDALPLTEAQRSLITVSALSTISGLEAVFLDTLEHFHRASHLSQASSVFIAGEGVDA